MERATLRDGSDSRVGTKGSRRSHASSEEGADSYNLRIGLQFGLIFKHF